MSERERIPNRNLNDYELQLTAALKRLLSPASRKALEDDTEDVSKIMAKIEEEDEDYKYEEDMIINGRIVGKIIESFVSDFMKCPKCGNLNLHMYMLANMPAVDLVCITCKCYVQVKASSGTPFRGQQYFNSTHIHVGSPNFGKFFHHIDMNDMEPKIPLVYVCVLFQIEPNNDVMILDGSFVIKPNDIPSADKWHYMYVDKNMVAVNPETTNINPLSIYLEPKIIPNDYIIKTEPIHNPSIAKQLFD